LKEKFKNTLTLRCSKSTRNCSSKWIHANFINWCLLPKSLLYWVRINLFYLTVKTRPRSLKPFRDIKNQLVVEIFCGICSQKTWR
jgi:hypothetical protein